MQYVDCVVRLSGDINFQVPKHDISVAEVALLRAMHGGEDGVVNITPTRKGPDSPAAVKRRMLVRYINTGGAELIEKLFPGMSPRLPETLADIGLELDLSTMDAREKRGPRAVRIEAPDLSAVGDADDGSYTEEDAAREAAENAARERAEAEREREDA